MSNLFNGQCLSERPIASLRSGPATVRSALTPLPGSHVTWTSAPMPLYAARQRSLFAHVAQAPTRAVDKPRVALLAPFSG